MLAGASDLLIAYWLRAGEIAEVAFDNLFGSPLLCVVAAVELKRLMPYVLAKMSMALAACGCVCCQGALKNGRV